MRKRRGDIVDVLWKAAPGLEGSPGKGTEHFKGTGNLWRLEGWGGGQDHEGCEGRKALESMEGEDQRVCAGCRNVLETGRAGSSKPFGL